jgi:hypothetical protein
MKSVTGALLLSMVLAAGVVLYLQTRDARSSLDAVDEVATSLRESGVSGKDLDRKAATRMLETLERLTSDPAGAADHVDELRVFGETAAAWARNAPSPSTDLHLAVALRSAASDLRSWALNHRQYDLESATSALARARAVIEGRAPEGDSMQGMRDQLENLQRSEQEQRQQVDEELDN